MWLDDLDVQSKFLVGHVSKPSFLMGCMSKTPKFYSCMYRWEGLKLYTRCILVYWVNWSTFYV
jgi:hypothetical protein